MRDLILKKEAYDVIGSCMEVHQHLGHGFSEIVYKDALEYELKQEKFHLSGKKNLRFTIRT